MTMTYHREIPLDEDPYRGCKTQPGMRNALSAAGISASRISSRADLAVLLDKHGLSLCRHYTTGGFAPGGGTRLRRLRCQQRAGHEGMCAYCRRGRGGQGGTWTRWWGANQPSGKPAPAEADPCTALRELRWAPYQEFGIPDPAAENLQAPSGPVRIGSVGYRDDDIIVYWERA